MPRATFCVGWRKSDSSQVSITLYEIPNTVTLRSCFTSKTSSQTRKSSLGEPKTSSLRCRVAMSMILVRTRTGQPVCVASRGSKSELPNPRSMVRQSMMVGEDITVVTVRACRLLEG